MWSMNLSQEICRCRQVKIRNEIVDEMRIKMEINVGDTLKLKKQHPCGSREWEVLRVGADFRLKCKGCGHQIMIARKLLEKNVKEILPGE